MLRIHAKNGYDLRVSGAPTDQIVAAKAPRRVAVVPERIPFIKPRLVVRSGDTVRIGSPLFFDKRHPALHYRSPGAGTISDIRFGPRRVISQIIIDLDDSEAAEPLLQARLDPTATLNRQAVTTALVNGGLWPLIRALPYRDMAPVDGPQPPALIVSLSDREPFHPHPDIYLDGAADLFTQGLAFLKPLASKLMVTVDEGAAKTIAMLGGAVTHCHRGVYPAGDPGVTLYHTRRSSADNPSWFIRGQDVLLVASLLSTGVYPTDRLVAVGGPAAPHAVHVKTRLGAPLSTLVDLPKDAAIRTISGGLFTGARASVDDYLGFFETAITVLGEGAAEEFLALIMPGRRRPSYSRVFLSTLTGGDMNVDCNMHGDLRACVACSYCNRVCPVEMLPQLAFKSLLAEEIEEALAHGLLDCVECGLCSYVCPSKIDISGILTQGKRNYYKEQQQ
ncbi:MAG: 4Fe-4S dicluster domain-containing protein [Pseudomonadota bacterium]